MAQKRTPQTTEYQEILLQFLASAIYPDDSATYINPSWDKFAIPFHTEADIVSICDPEWTEGYAVFMALLEIRKNNGLVRESTIKKIVKKTIHPFLDVIFGMRSEVVSNAVEESWAVARHRDKDRLEEELLKALKELQKNVLPTQIAQKLVSAVGKLRIGITDTPMMSDMDRMREFKRTVADPMRSTVIPLFNEEIDSQSGGIGTAEATLIMAPTGNGKTTIVWNWAEQLRQLGYMVLIISNETNTISLEQRRLSRWLGVPLLCWKKGFRDVFGHSYQPISTEPFWLPLWDYYEAFTKLHASVGEIMSVPMLNSDVSAILSKMDDAYQVSLIKGKRLVVFVDYIQNIQRAGMIQKNDSEQIADIGRQIRERAMALNAYCIIMSQADEDISGPYPRLSKILMDKMQAIFFAQLTEASATAKPKPVTYDGRPYYNFLGQPRVYGSTRYAGEMGIHVIKRNDGDSGGKFATKLELPIGMMLNSESAEPRRFDFMIDALHAEDGISMIYDLIDKMEVK